MTGSLALENGLLYIGTEEKAARVRVFDLDGHPVGEGLRFCDPRLGRSCAAGVAVDGDHRIWVADTPASRVRLFTLFGPEEGGLGLPVGSPIRAEDALGGGVGAPDRRGEVHSPVDVSVSGHGDEGRVVVACAGERRHAVQVFDITGSYAFSPKPLGEPHGRFRFVRGVTLGERMLAVAEGGAGRVQLFRDGDFHFAFRIPTAGGATFEPSAVALLSDGRMVVSAMGRNSGLLLVDSAGRLLSQLARAGSGPGEVNDPTDVVVEEAERDARSRVVAIDLDGERVQVFTLTGRCFGAFEERA